MPRKDRNSYNKYMREYMRKMRIEQKRALRQLKVKYPKAYQDIFGKPKRSRKK